MEPFKRILDAVKVGVLRGEVVFDAEVRIEGCTSQGRILGTVISGGGSSKLWFCKDLAAKVPYVSILMSTAQAFRSQQSRPDEYFKLQEKAREFAALALEEYIDSLIKPIEAVDLLDSDAKNFLEAGKITRPRILVNNGREILYAETTSQENNSEHIIRMWNALVKQRFEKHDPIIEEVSNVSEKKL